MKPYKITIIGLGLIGGSLARALREKLGIRGITAVDPDSQSLREALMDGTIEKGFTELDCSIDSSDIIFVCTPVKQAKQYIEALAPRISENCIVTDVCSTKGEITGFVEALAVPPVFIGGHPMAGTEKSGYANSFSHLFENVYYVLTPCSSTTKEALDKLQSIIEEIGAIPILMSSGEHDRATGGISHLPHVIASALVNLVQELDNGSGKMQTLAAGGFRDITRIASSSPAMWENIITSNRTQILELLELFVERLRKFGASVSNSDSEAVYRFFNEARLFRDSLSTQATGLIKPVNKLIVDVEDKPGIIGEIATILGHHNINIKNINVTNSREFEQGCLVIALPDADSVNIAFDLLMDTGYKVFKTR